MLLVCALLDSYFNPRSHKGSDLECHFPSSKSSLFQSTLPQGERRNQKHYSWLDTIFQSTLPQGERRRNWMSSPESKKISIHAPTRGATDPLHNMAWSRFCISIHAPTRGATEWCTYQYNNNYDFNPRSHKGSDRYYHGDTGEPIHFNPRSHKGSDETHT